MKKIVSLFLSMVLFVSCLATYSNVVYAEDNTDNSNEISTLAEDKLEYTNKFNLNGQTADTNGDKKYAFYTDASCETEINDQSISLNSSYTGEDKWIYFQVSGKTNGENRTIYVTGINGYEIENISNDEYVESEKINGVYKLTLKAPVLDAAPGTKIWLSGLFRTKTVDLEDYINLAKVNFTVNESGCTVDGNREAEKHPTNETEFTVIPTDEKYTNVKVLVNGKEVSVNDMKFKVSNAADATINVSCTPTEKHTTYNVSITGEGSLNGVSGNTVTVVEGSNAQTLQAVADKGHYIKAVTLNGTAVEVSEDGTFTVSYIDEKEYDLQVVFDATTIVLNSNEYTLGYKGSIIVDDNLYQTLYSDLVDLNLSSSDLPDLYNKNDVQILYQYKHWLGFEDWKQLDDDFGGKTTEIIKFKFNNVESSEITVTFEDSRNDSSIIFKDNAEFTYTKDAETFKNNIYSTIDFESSVLPEGLTKKDFKYYFEVNLYDVISNGLGVEQLDKILNSIPTGIPGVTEAINQLKQNQYVNIDDGTTVGQMIDNYPLLIGIKSLLGEDICNQSLMPSVGTAKVKVAYEGNTDYKPVEAETEVTITKATSSVKINDASIVYGESIPSDLVVCNPSDVNKLVLYVGMDANLNGFVSIDLPNGLIYDAVEKLYPNGFTLDQLTEVLEGLNVAVNSEELDQILAQIPDAVKGFKVQFGQQPKDSGLYVVAALTLDNNYTNSFDLGTLTIAPKTENVTLSFISEMPENNIFTYEDVQNFVFGGVCNEPDAQVRHVYVGVDYNGNPVVSETPIKEPGVYTETVYVLGGNYYANPISRGYVVRRQKMTIEFNKTDFTYTGNEIDLNAIVKDSYGNVIDNADVTYSYVGCNGADIDGLPTDAGTYLVTAVYLGDAEYGFGFETAKITIHKADPEVSANDVNATYNGQAVEADYTVPAYVNANDVTVKYYDANVKELTSAPVNAGEYTYEVSVAKSDNYNSATATGKINIAKAPLTINIADTGKTYNDADPKLEYTVSGLIDGEEIDVTVSREAGEDVGTYAITATYTNAENYEVTVNEGVFTIGKAQPVISLEDKNKTYDGEALEGAYTVSEYVDASDVSVKYYDVNGKELTSAPVNAGKYTYVVSVAANKNYKTATATGNIVIEKVQPVISLDNINVVYNGKAVEVKYEVPSYVDEKDVSVQYFDASGKELSSAPVEVGEYTYVVTVKEGINYLDASATGKISISAVTVTPGDNDSPNTPDKAETSDTKTGDTTQFYTYVFMLIISLGVVILLKVRMTKE